MNKKIIYETLQSLYEYDSNFFSYGETCKSLWNDLLKTAMEEFEIHFDVENNDTKKIQRIIIIPQTQWEHTQCKFKCELWCAGGDWQIPVLYFKCQLIDGYGFGLNKFKNDGSFIYIPGKKEGNYHLVPTSKGDEWCSPDDDHYKKGIDPEPNEKKCWESLKNYLTILVNKEIESVRTE